MQPKLKRSELDHLAKIYSLDPSRIETMFEAAGARPTRIEGLVFLGHCLRIAGVLSLASALVFFVAANWSRLAVFGRFALLELVLLGCGALAFVRPPPAFLGRSALFVAFIASGALLALFGQTYQTGADVYELFLSWSLLALPLVDLSRWSVATAAWVLVFNTALALYCGWQPAGGLLWTLLDGPRFGVADVLLAAATVNVVFWFIAEWWRHPAVPDWVRRLVLSCAFSFGTWAGILAFLDVRQVFGARDASSLSLPGLGLLMVAVAIYTLRRRHDIFPLAVLLGTFIIVSLVGIATGLEWNDEIGFFVLALWLIVTSTLGGRWLMSIMRSWRLEGRA